MCVHRQDAQWALWEGIMAMEDKVYVLNLSTLPWVQLSHYGSFWEAGILH